MKLLITNLNHFRAELKAEEERIEAEQKAEEERLKEEEERKARKAAAEKRMTEAKARAEVSRIYYECAYVKPHTKQTNICHVNIKGCGKIGSAGEGKS